MRKVVVEREYCNSVNILEYHEFGCTAMYFTDNKFTFIIFYNGTWVINKYHLLV